MPDWTIVPEAQCLLEFMMLVYYRQSIGSFQRASKWTLSHDKMRMPCAVFHALWYVEAHACNSLKRGLQIITQLPTKHRRQHT